MADVIGFTTSLPVELIFAADKIPVDLNNIFITGSDAADRIMRAESAGFPRSFCSWIKGIYQTVLETKPSAVIGVTQGDCSNTHVLMDLLEEQGARVIPFAYPPYPSGGKDFLAQEIEKLGRTIGTDFSRVPKIKQQADAIRELLQEVDDLTWKTGQVSGGENALWLITASDFRGSLEKFEIELKLFLAEARRRPRKDFDLKIGIVGIPPIYSDLFDVVESLGLKVAFNELPRQFAMLNPPQDLADQYLKFTYPYGIRCRIEDIRRETGRRGLAGIIHYAQSFCFRQAEDILLRKYAGVPVLTIEGDRPGSVDARLRTRLESFSEMLFFHKKQL